MTQRRNKPASKGINRRAFARLVAGAAVVPAVGGAIAPANVEPETAALAKPQTSGELKSSGDAPHKPPVFAELGNGTLQWSIGNAVLSQHLLLRQGRFSCASLLNRDTGREWIHPTESSDEFLVQVSQPSGQPVTLTGKEQWQYLNHSIGKPHKGWNELIVDLKSAHLALTLRRHYWWHETLPIVRQRTSIRNESDEKIIIQRLDIFRLRLSPVPEALELSWMNNFCRAMKPNPGNPIHYCSIDDNSQYSVQTGPYSPDCAWFSLATPKRREGLVGGWEWSGPVNVDFGDMREPCLIQGGLDAQGMAERLAPGCILDAPVGWYGFFEGSLDRAANLSHDFVRSTLGPTLPVENYPWVGYCTWACSRDKDNPHNEKDSHPWFPSQQNLLSQVDAASEMGCELFLWDYGWFPQVGDWWCDAKRFPDGPRTIVNRVKQQRMKLGLWFGFGNANEASTVVAEHPDWLATYGGKPIPDKFFTRTGASVWNTRILCLAHRPAREWVKEQLSRVIEEFELDWLKHDFDLMTICQAENHTHTPGDSRIAACEGFYDIMDFVRGKYPQVLCENWMNNSAVPDYGVLQRHHMQLIGDSYRAFSLRQMFYGHSQIFPPDRQHRYLRLEDSEGEFTNMIRSGAIGGPWTLLSDPRRFNAGQKQMLKKEILFYKRYRYILGRARVYRLLGRPHPRGWDGIQLYDSQARRGIIYVFRSNHPASQQVVVLDGLEERASYKLEYQDGNTSRTLTGRQLVTAGVPVHLSKPNTSEVIVVTKVAG
jgi:Melibiase